MSSVVHTRTLPAVDTEWVQVREAAVAPSGLDILRSKLAAAAGQTKTVVIDDFSGYGSGDCDVALDIASDMASRWDS